MTSRIDTAIIAIATKTAEANDKATKALENSKNAGLISPTKISEEVGNALANTKTPSKIIEEQSKFENAQVASAVKFAIEKGKFYIEDALTPELRQKVFDGYYKIVCQKMML